MLEDLYFLVDLRAPQRVDVCEYICEGFRHSVSVAVRILTRFVVKHVQFLVGLP